MKTYTLFCFILSHASSFVGVFLLLLNLKYSRRLSVTASLSLPQADNLIVLLCFVFKELKLFCSTACAHSAVIQPRSKGSCSDKASLQEMNSTLFCPHPLSQIWMGSHLNHSHCGFWCDVPCKYHSCP